MTGASSSPSTSRIGGSSGAGTAGGGSGATWSSAKTAASLKNVRGRWSGSAPFCCHRLELLTRGWAWRPDPDRRFATADAIAQPEPSLESGDPGGRRPLHRDQQLVAERVTVKAGAGSKPRLPTLGAAQPFDGVTGVLAITLATLGALLVGELPSLFDGHPSALLSWGPAGCGADPRPQGARQGATIGRGRPRSR